MKKIIITILCFAMVLSLCSCKSDSKLPKELNKIIDGVYENTQKVIERQATEDEELNVDNCEHWTGFSAEEFDAKIEKGLKRQYVVTAIGQGIVVVEVKQGQNVKKVFDEMCEKANLNKFGCLPAQAGRILVSGNHIAIIWGFSESSDFDYSCNELVDAFEKLVGKTDYSYDIIKIR